MRIESIDPSIYKLFNLSVYQFIDHSINFPPCLLPPVNLSFYLPINDLPLTHSRRLPFSILGVPDSRSLRKGSKTFLRSHVLHRLLGSTFRSPGELTTIGKYNLVVYAPM